MSSRTEKGHILIPVTMLPLVSSKMVTNLGQLPRIQETANLTRSLGRRARGGGGETILWDTRERHSQGERLLQILSGWQKVRIIFIFLLGDKVRITGENRRNPTVLNNRAPRGTCRGIVPPRLRGWLQEQVTPAATQVPTLRRALSWFNVLPSSP